MNDKLIKESHVIKEMRRIGVDPEGIKIMKDKSIFRIIRISNVRTPLANIIKEGMLSAGGDAALHKLACACKKETTDVLLMGTLAQYKHLLSRLRLQPYSGKEIARRIRRLIVKTSNLQIPSSKQIPNPKS